MRHEDIPDINNPKTMKAVLEGDKLMKEVLNGGYNVHPVPPPNSEIKERIRKIIYSRIYHFWRPLKDRYKIISKSSKQAGHY